MRPFDALLIGRPRRWLLGSEFPGTGWRCITDISLVVFISQSVLTLWKFLVALDELTSACTVCSHKEFILQNIYLGLWETGLACIIDPIDE